MQPSYIATYVALGRRLTQHTAPPENNTPIKHTSGCHQHQDNGNSGLTWLASHSGKNSMVEMSNNYNSIEIIELPETPSFGAFRSRRKEGKISYSFSVQIFLV